MKKFFACTLILALITACRHGPGLTEDQVRIADIYVQIIRLEEHFPAGSPAFQDSVRKIIALSGLTEKTYRETITYFCEKPERWEAFYKEVLNRLNIDETQPLSSQK